MLRDSLGKKVMKIHRVKNVKSSFNWTVHFIYFSFDSSTFQTLGPGTWKMRSTTWLPYAPTSFVFSIAAIS